MESLAVALSVDEFLALPDMDDDTRCELIDGVLAVMGVPSMRHERIVARLIGLLHAALDGRDDLALFGSNGGVVMPPDSMLRPDCFVCRLPSGGAHADWRDLPVPLLVVEVLSPSTGARDRGVKREHYLRAGVQELWLVDGDAEAVERWWAGRAESEVAQRRLAFRFDAGWSGAIDLDAVFRVVDG